MTPARRRLVCAARTGCTGRGVECLLVQYYVFEWDDGKARANERKHRDAFEEAKTCFEDPFAVESLDVIHSVDEERLMLIGRSDRDRILVIAYTVRGNNIRIISARKATSRERLAYETQINS